MWEDSASSREACARNRTEHEAAWCLVPAQPPSGWEHLGQPATPDLSLIHRSEGISKL